ncbi:PhnE/PtxC family ABC transporter permease [Teredinibacter turnerae]|uniref:PhnE/PtxC family ABC transporter permease n=1 Tax=Teredinibacter turnerae TaxID=2426 RepID=UPI001E3F11C7|nr:hypothetical protein [Teredinibacter turnerae]
MQRFLNQLKAAPLRAISVGFVLLAAVLMPAADLQIYASNPWQEIGRMGVGLITPRWESLSELAMAIAQTVAFALLGVVGSVIAGLALTRFYYLRIVRVFCASIRAVHELFWALIFMQVFGLSALTGLLAIALPYSGIFAKVFSEIFGQQPVLPAISVAGKSNKFPFSAWLYTQFAQALPQIRSYTRYRFECALRSSTLLGFVGLPTLGFYFETAFKQGQYSEAACLLWCFYLLIASLRYWLHWRIIPLYIIAAWLILPESPPLINSYVWQFFSRDIWPVELIQGDYLGALHWYGVELRETIFPAAAYTLIISIIALVATGLLTLLLYPAASNKFAGRFAFLGHAVLLFFRSTPEFVLAFVLLLLLGPSALPAIIALAIHNSGLISYLIARHSNDLSLRPDALRGLNLYCYEVTPRLYPAFMGLLLYRWEVIMRETAILGILGVTTLGFYVDSAFEEIRYDRALLLVATAAFMNIIVDSLSRRLARAC